MFKKLILIIFLTITLSSSSSVQEKIGEKYKAEIIKSIPVNEEI